MGKKGLVANVDGLWVVIGIVLVGALLLASAALGAGQRPDARGSDAPRVSAGPEEASTSGDVNTAAAMDVSALGIRQMAMDGVPMTRIAGGGELPSPSGQAGQSPMDAPFGTEVPVAEGVETQQGVSVGVSSGGTIYVAYENETSPGNFDLFVAYSTDGGLTWTNVAVPPPEAGMSERNPAITVTPSAITVFFEQYTYDQRFYYAQSVDNGVSYTTTAIDMAGSDFYQFRNPDTVSYGSWSWVAWDIYDGYVNGMSQAIDVRTVTWWWSKDDWATLTGSFWICHSSVSDDRASPPCQASNSEDWTRPNIATNATTAAYADAPLNNPAAAINQFFHVDTAFLSNGDGSESLYFLYYDATQSTFYFFPSWVWNGLFGFGATPEFGPDIVAGVEGWFMSWTWDLSSEGFENWTVGMTYDDSTFFLTFVGVPPDSQSDYIYPKTYYTNGILWTVFFNSTVAGTDVNFVFSLDFASTWSPVYKVNSNSPGTAVGGRRTIGLAGTVDEPLIAWTDTRSGNPDVYFSGFGSYSLYVVTKSPADPGLLAAGVSVNGTFEPAPAAHIWPWGSVQNVSVNATEQASPDTRYVFSSWSDGGAIAHDITITQGTTFLTANYAAQYLLTMSASLGTVSPTTGWYDEGVTVMIQAFSPSPTWGWGERYNWNGWLGTSNCGFEYTGAGAGGNHYANVTMMCPITEQSSWNHQFYLDVSSPYGTTTGTGWYSQGFTVPFSVSPTTVSTGPNQRVTFDLWSGQGNGSYDGTNNPWTVTLNAPIVETALWSTEYRLTVNTNFGIVDPPGGWFEAGTSVNISAIPPAAALGERYLWNGWTGTVAGMNNPITVTISGPTTETAEWGHEFYLTVASPYGTTTGEGWYVDGTTANAGLNTGTAGGPDTRWVFAQWSGDAAGTNFASSNPITMNAPKTAVAQWTTQHYLTVTSPYGTTSGQGWYDDGTVAAAGLDTGLVSGGTDTRYQFVRWGGAATGTSFLSSDPITMNGPKTAVAEWKTQYTLTVSGNVGTVDPPSGWYDEGSVLYVTASPPSLVFSTGERYVWNGWSGSVASTSNPLQITMSGPMTETADWGHEFYLTVTSPHGTTSGEGWYLDVDTPTAGLAADIVGGPSTRWVFAQWSGDATGTSFASSNPITMDAPKTAVAQWTTQHYLTVTSPYGTTSGEGWYDEGTDAFAGLDVNQVPGGVGTRFAFVQWTKDGSGTNYLQSNAITMAGPREAQAEWVTQYELTISTNVIGGSTSPSTNSWFDAGSSVPITTAVPNPVAGERYLFGGWTGIGAGSYSGMGNPASITMLGPITQTAVWNHEFYLTVVSFTGAPTGEGWYAEGVQAAFSVQTPSGGGTGIRYQFVAWTGDSTSTNPSDALTMSGPKRVDATWQTQFLLTVITSHSAGSCDVSDCWYDDGASATATVSSGLETGAAGTQYEFRGWGGAASGTGTSSDPFTMDGPKTAAAVWVTQYELSVSAMSGTTALTGVSVSLDGSVVGTTPATAIWLDAGTSHLVEAASLFVSGTDKYTFDQWFGGGTSPGMSVTLTQPLDITAQYVLATSGITGTVRGEGGGDPVAGATVEAGGVQATTTSDGTYTLVVPDGTYTVTVTHDNYVTASESGVNVGIGETVTVDFLMEIPNDSDADGLPDDWEASHFGNLDQGPSGDPDGDGFTNMDEYVRGTDPNGADFMAQFWWLWLVLFLIFVVLAVVMGLLGRRRGRPAGEAYEELYGVPPAAEEVVVTEEVVEKAPVKEEKPSVPPPPEEEEAEAAKAAPLPECPNCGLINEAGAKECAVCGSSMGPKELTNEERVARLDQALKDGRITTEQYQANLKKIMGH